MSSSIHGRDQIDYVKIGAKRDGTITGLECTAIADLGAYYTLLTPFIPCFTGLRDQRLLQDPEPQVHGQGRLHQQDGAPTPRAAPAGPRRPT